MKNQLVILAMTVASFATYAQHDHNAHAKQKGSISFKDEKVTTAYMHYVHLKEALVSSNAEEARKAADELQSSLGNLSDGAKAAAAAKKISASSELKVQRTSFSALSNEMTEIVKANKLEEGSIYVEYCPMANKNQGALWLSNEKEIKNPYFGNTMLKCGSVKETIQ